MNRHQPQQDLWPSGHANPSGKHDWEPWMYDSFSQPQGNQDTFHLQQQSRQRAPYSDNTIPIHAPSNSVPHRDGPEYSPKTNPFHAQRHILGSSANPPQYTEQPGSLSYVSKPGRNYANSHSTDTPIYTGGAYFKPPNGGVVPSQDLLPISRGIPASSSLPPLPQPIAIPQTLHGRGQPFLRAWPPSLHDQGISQAAFLSFIDGLNIASAPNPPLQALDAAGGFLGMVPHHWAQLAGNGIQATARLGTAVVSKARMDMYLSEANDKMFAPKRLRVSVMSSEGMRAVVGIPEAAPTLVPLTRETMQMTTLERELLAVRPYCAELELDVPQPEQQKTLLAKLSAKQVEGAVRKNQKSAMKEREKAMEKQEKKERRDEKERAKREKKREKRAKKKDAKNKRDSETSDESDGDGSDGRLAAESKVGTKDGKKSKEDKKAEKVMWVVIENL